MAFEKYEILDKIGEGSFGEVLLAKDKNDNKKVALKLIRKDIARKLNIDRLAREFYLMSKNRSPFIADVYEFYPNEKQPYFAMEYLSGATLDDYLADDKFTFNREQAARLIIALAMGLEHIHASGIIHGDLKPSNIMLQNRDGDFIPKILDFGLASTKGSSSDISGSIGWMAPEILLGKGSGILSDIYSFAVITLQILTGINPFIAERASETIERHLELEPQIPKVGLLENTRIREILTSMLSKKPHERPSNAYFLRVALSIELGVKPSEKPSEIFLPQGDPILDDLVKSVIDNIVGLSGKKQIGCQIDDNGRFKRFLREIQPELSIRGFSYFDLNQLNKHLCKILSDVLSSESEKKMESLLYQKVEDFRALYGEYLLNSTSAISDRTQFINYLVEIIEEYSMNVPVVVNSLGITDENLKNRLTRMKHRGKILILDEKKADSQKDLLFTQFNLNNVRNYILSVLNPYIGDDEIFDFLRKESTGLIDRIDTQLRQMIANGEIIQSENGWDFKFNRLKKEKTGKAYKTLDKNEIKILSVLYASEIPLPARLLSNITGLEKFYHAIQNLFRLGLIDEATSPNMHAYYDIEDRELTGKIIGEIDPSLYDEIASAIETSEIKGPKYIALRISLLARANKSDEWLEIANDSIKTLKSLKAYDAMLSIYKVLAEHFKIINMPVKHFSNLKKAGLMCKYLGRFADANAIYDDALAIAREIARNDMLAAILNDIGVIHFENSALELALSYYKESAHIAEIDDNTKYILLGWSNIAGCLHLLFNFEDAEEYYRKALDLAEDSEYSIFAPVLCFNLGEMRLLQYDTQEAKRLFNRAITISKQVGQDSVLFESLLGSARLQLRTGGRRNLEKTLTDIQNMTEVSSITKYKFLLLLLKIEIAINQGKYNELEQFLQEASRLYPRLPLNLQSDLARLSIFANFIGIEINEEFNELEDKWDDYHLLQISSPPENKLLDASRKFYDRGDLLGYVALTVKLSRTSTKRTQILSKALNELPIKHPFIEAYLLECLGEAFIDEKEYNEATKRFNLARVAYGKANNEDNLERVEARINSIRKDEGAITSTEISKLLEIIKSINSDLEFEDVIKRILTEVIRISDADRGIVFLKQEEAPVVKMVMDSENNIKPLVRINYSHSIIDDVFKSRKSILKESVLADDEISSRESVMALDIKMVFCTPLIYEDDVLGAIYTDSKIGSEAFSDTRQNLLEALSANAAIAIHNARLHSNLKNENLQLRESFDEHFGGDKVIGKSLPMRKLYHKLSLISGEDVTVLLTGETGTGKDLIARTLHNESPRKSKSFIAINCAALPDTLLESELFGYEKGAFTGATMQKKGKFDQANGGTIFLNEIGEMPLALQAKLLSVLETKVFQRLGGTEDISVDARIITATNRDLAKEVEEGRFRNDLFYRLSVVRLSLPALRKRRDDIPALIRFFIERTNQKTSRDIKGIDPKVMDFLINYNWPGNVRELQNLIEEMSLFAASDYLSMTDIPQRLRSDNTSVETQKALARTYKELKEMKLMLEKESILATLNLNEWNIAEAARSFGIDRTRLHQLVTKHKLRNLK